jgi:site-specific recombinase XerD
MDGILTLEEFQERVMSCIEGSESHRTFESMRNITLYRLLFATGLRIRATLGIKRKNLDLEKNSVKVIEKGGRTCTRFFDSETADHITRLIEHMDSNLPGLNHSHLFITRITKRIQGKTQPIYRPMSYHRARDAVHQVVGVVPHMLRHSFALECVERGVDPFTLMNLMGHANVATTSIYTRKNEEMMKKDYGKYAPFG